MTRDEQVIRYIAGKIEEMEKSRAEALAGGAAHDYSAYTCVVGEIKAYRHVMGILVEMLERLNDGEEE